MSVLLHLHVLPQQPTRPHDRDAPRRRQNL